jgi:hypothetical protein
LATLRRHIGWVFQRVRSDVSRESANLPETFYLFIREKLKGCEVVDDSNSWENYVMESSGDIKRAVW